MQHSITKITASDSITSWQIDGETMATVRGFIFLGSKITAGSDYSHEFKRRLFLGRKAMTNLDSILKSRHYSADKGLHNQSYGFSSSYVWMWELYHKEGWAPKDCCFWTVVLEEILESPLHYKEINQSILKEINPECSLEILLLKLKLQYFSHLMRRADSLEKTGKDWRKEEKGMAGDKMVGWHHWLNGHEFELTLGDGEGQGSLVCYSPWGHKESDTTEWLKNNNCGKQYGISLKN